MSDWNEVTDSTSLDAAKQTITAPAASSAEPKAEAKSPATNGTEAKKDEEPTGTFLSCPMFLFSCALAHRLSLMSHLIMQMLRSIVDIHQLFSPFCPHPSRIPHLLYFHTAVDPLVELAQRKLAESKIDADKALGMSLVSPVYAPFSLRLVYVSLRCLVLVCLASFAHRILVSSCECPYEQYCN